MRIALFLVALCTLSAGCSSSSSSSDTGPCTTVTQTTCDRLAACLDAGPVGSCPAPTTCNVSEAHANACVSALQSAACSDLLAGHLPSACGADGG